MTAEERTKMLVEENAGIMDWEWIIGEAIRLTEAETIERCAKTIEDEDGWSWAFDPDKERPTQVSHINSSRSLKAMAEAIRALAGR